MLRLSVTGTWLAPRLPKVVCCVGRLVMPIPGTHSAPGALPCRSELPVHRRSYCRPSSESCPCERALPLRDRLPRSNFSHRTASR
ncbi:hypothetical protein ebA6369 [Aromatoleum aromaticum EbN1]|uniref:Uncharacterized protein n=1 Tax=Aromatoleum aromaticum (strain DSM 19018 / LMG 30748 / EbN1) TaxID=76114 RepID=Q5NYU9_AROAE|nr:hypothetical protein ebA6369 [Aromatoleum aromaticum EbN1]